MTPYVAKQHRFNATQITEDNIRTLTENHCIGWAVEPLPKEQIVNPDVTTRLVVNTDLLGSWVVEGPTGCFVLSDADFHTEFEEINE